MPFDVVGHVCCAAITQFYSVRAEYFIKFVMWRKMLFDKVKENLTDISLHARG